MPQICITQNGSVWYWEVTQDRDVIAHGMAATHAQARADAANASRPSPPLDGIQRVPAGAPCGYI